MAIRDAFKDNSYSISSDDGTYVEEVDLTVEPWNRQTVADGQWLNDHAIAPLSARDVYLADCIDEANATLGGLLDRVNEITEVSGENKRAVAVNSINHAADPNSTALTAVISEKSTILPQVGNYFVPTGALSYFTYNENSKNHAVIQANFTSGKASQIRLTEDGGLAYRFISANTLDEISVTATTGATTAGYTIPYAANLDKAWNNFISAPDVTDAGAYVYRYYNGGASFNKLSAGSGLNYNGNFDVIYVNLATNSHLGYNNQSALKCNLTSDGTTIKLTNDTFAVNYGDGLTATGCERGGRTETMLAVAVDDDTVKISTDSHKLYVNNRYTNLADCGIELKSLQDDNKNSAYCLPIYNNSYSPGYYVAHKSETGISWANITSTVTGYLTAANGQIDVNLTSLSAALTGSNDFKAAITGSCISNVTATSNGFLSGGATNLGLDINKLVSGYGEENDPAKFTISAADDVSPITFDAHNGTIVSQLNYLYALIKDVSSKLPTNGG